jgi:kynurenine formamidase
MKVIDLTHTISETMPVYPGTEPPRLDPANSYEKDGFKETLISMYSHTGTHVDPPAHLFADRTTLDAFPVSQFVGKAVVIDCRHLNEGEAITMKELASQREDAEKADYLLFNLGWDKRWGTPAYYGDYPCIDDKVVEFILATNKKGIGFDVIGVDPIPDADLPRHKKLFKEHEIVNIENLTNLDKCGKAPFWFFALPLKWEKADGAPIRAIAFFEE